MRTLRWLGQAGFLFTCAGTTVAVDPFLSDYQGRRFPSPIGLAELATADVVLCTHEHADHFDLPALVSACRAGSLSVVVPEPLVKQALAAGISPSHLRGVQPGDTVQIGTVTVQAVPALHGVHVEDAYTFGQEISNGSYRYLGYVLNLDGLRVYHAGDTLGFDGQVDLLRQLRVDVCLLPINGRDQEREARDIVGNLSAAEAAKIAVKSGAWLVVPIHYDLMCDNRGPLGAFVELVAESHPETAVLVPPLGRVVTVPVGPAEE
jgi:L-ascorbate metabolism protein UlaG (beta-lactamase superfamily)